MKAISSDEPITDKTVHILSSAFDEAAENAKKTMSTQELTAKIFEPLGKLFRESHDNMQGLINDSENISARLDNISARLKTPKSPQ